MFNRGTEGKEGRAKVASIKEWVKRWSTLRGAKILTKQGGSGSVRGNAKKVKKTI